VLQGLVKSGVDDNWNMLVSVGLSDNDLATWTHDAVGDQVARYAHPSGTFELELKSYK